LGKLAEARGQYPVARRERVSDRRLPAAGARTREDEDPVTLGLEPELHVGEQAEREVREIERALVLERHVHGPAQAAGQVGLSGDEPGVASGYHVAFSRLSSGSLPGVGGARRETGPGARSTGPYAGVID
jgi:hypothetical protein